METTKLPQNRNSPYVQHMFRPVFIFFKQITSISNGVAISSMEAFMTELANSGWLKHIKAVLDTSVAVVQNILEGTHALIFEYTLWI